ncbi:hypothetical protein BSZ39_00860 [Bowdeniella nasicola]|uniref:MaoC-like domain-containing protein n=1 Tax=Bowdeniella nasicola TaxID=208480 RepID=A0A1Q5Q5X7_9ACTO|nr:MaoC/PaaZ C-terminal domain-containing protein [Bowdeniella nasicola]OKL55112.1 hypothetical protein BSZ39_00860 [Bowdeniella nasicola]
MSSEISVGDELFATTVEIDRTMLVAYAGASGDHNPIHYNDAAASAAGLPGVLAHGMLTMGLAATALAQWADDPHLVTEVSTRFSRPVVVPGDGVATLDIVGVAGEVTDEAIRVDLKVTCEGKGVLTRARALVEKA